MRIDVGSVTRRPLHIAFIVALLLGLALAVASGEPHRALAWGSAARATPDKDPAGADAVCPPDGDPAEIGAAVVVDGITILLEEPTDRSIGRNSLTASITGKDGAPLADALVYLTIRMPSMDHGVSAYPAAERDVGRYRAEDVSLGMGGEWVVTVEVIRQARAPVTATYRIGVTET
jgi:hypothetical protein